jgi:hypothetical protein
MAPLPPPPGEEHWEQYLERVEQQMSNLRPGIARDVLPGVSVEMTGRFATHERHYENEFRQLNRNLVTLSENFYAFQHNINKQMSQINRKMDLLLEVQGRSMSSAGQSANQDRNLLERTLGEGACRGKDEDTDRAAMAVKEQIAAATAANHSTVSPPPKQASNPLTTIKHPTPLSAKEPIMAAALTSTPPHVPQPPPSQSQSSPLAKVTITDVSIPSPSAVSDARRIRERDMVEQGNATKEKNRRACFIARGLANTTPFHDRGSDVHPALRYQEDIESLAGGKDKQQVAEKQTQDDRDEVLWKRPSDNGEIGGRWYKAAMGQ